MSWGGSDQAEGLRRMLSPTPTRVIALASIGGGEGLTTVATGLAAALVLQGKDVLLVDEQPAHAGSASGLWAPAGAGTSAGLGTGAPVQTECGAELVALPPSEASREQGSALFARRAPGGLVLIDAALDAQGRLSPLAQSADELLLVLRPRVPSITTAYAGIKELHYAHGLRRLRFLVNGAAGEREARPVMTNLAGTGSRYLAVTLQPAGWVHADPHLADARRLGRTVVDAFPASPAALDLRRVAGDLLNWPRGAAQLPGRSARPAPAIPAEHGVAA